MDTKRNDATRNRPEGDRVIDGSVVISDIASYTEQLMEEKAWEKNDRNGITVFKSENMTMVLSALKQGADLGHNTIDGFVIIQVLKGEIEIVSQGNSNELSEQHIITFHPGIEHNIIAKSDANILITNYSRMSSELKNHS